jgi:ATP-dependent Lon protease
LKKRAKRAPETPDAVPVMPLRDLVVFPGMVLPLYVGRRRSVAAIEHAMAHDRRLVLVPQRRAADEDPKPEDLHSLACLAEVAQVLKLPDGALRVLLEGMRRVQTLQLDAGGAFMKTQMAELPDNDRLAADAREEALTRSAIELFEQYVKLGNRLPAEVVVSALNVSHLGRLADTIAAPMLLRSDAKQKLFEILDPLARLEAVHHTLNSELEILSLEKRIQGRVRKSMEKGQREAYLHEQMRVIQRELGKAGEAPGGESAELRKKLEAAKLPKEARDKASKELDRFERMAAYSAEASVVRSYLDWLADLPWAKRSKDRLDLELAEKILDEDHHGLKSPKQRIVEHLAVRRLVGRDKGVKGPILCLVGPPGVGKTSLAKSVARAMGREFARLALGGVRDEAEIRGHRRTYIGAMPGRLIQALRRCNTKNPVFLLDEVDKLASDFRGDPASALLEVLDPEQNNTFTDHYIDTPFDLSEVLFFCTANDLSNIPHPLRDRMEIIEIPGYTEEEKLAIAERFLLPKQIRQHGLKPAQLTLGDGVLLKLVRDYTREAGVRSLERQIMALCRKAAREAVRHGRDKTLDVETKALQTWLGLPKYRREDERLDNHVGVATGLAWTEAGGEVLCIEAALFKGKGGLMLTGKLGEVMRESAQAALSCVRARAISLGLPQDFHRKFDIHLHIPEGATPKDGPSAGITMATAMASALTLRPIKPSLAMTGEVTLRGRVLAVGGIKEKILAARRAGATVVLLPRANQRDLEELPESARKGLRLVLVSSIDQVFELALEKRRKAMRTPFAESHDLPEAEAWEGNRLPSQ